MEIWIRESFSMGLESPFRENPSWSALDRVLDTLDEDRNGKMQKSPKKERKNKHFCFLNGQ